MAEIKDKSSFDKLRILDDRQQAREKLPTFYGSRDNYYHGFREVCLNNTIDEISNNFDKGIVDIWLHDDNKTITVLDSGRGMPINEKTDGVWNWEIFFRILFASGKYDIEDEENSGTNGVGGTVLNYSSELFKVTSYYNGKEYIINFKDGGNIDTPLTYIGETDKHGTKITFKLDEEIYTETTFNINELKEMINKVSGVSPKVTFKLHYKDTTELIHYDTNEEYYIKNIQEDNYIVCNQKIYDMNNETTKIDLIFSPSIDNIQQAFLNRNYLCEGGIINKSLIIGIKDYTHKYIKNNSLYNKNEKPITFEDVDNTISFMINVISSDVEFQSQTKFATKKNLYGILTKQYIQEQLQIIEIENIDWFKNLVNQILLTKRVNESAESKRKETRKQLESGLSNAKTRPDKYVPHNKRSTPKEDIEVIWVEGNSALNPLKTSRDASYTGIYPLRGKPINVLKNSLDDVLKNQEIKDTFQILGCGVTYHNKKVKGLPIFDINKLNIGKILITTDRDVDGGHIESLLLALFYTFTPELIKQGKVYILYTPLYIIKYNKKEVFAYTEEERNNIIKDLTNKNIKYSEMRFKGVGGLSPKVLSQTAMNKENRVMKRVQWKDIKKGMDIINLCMSKEEAEARKQYIESEGHKYFDFSLIAD